MVIRKPNRRARRNSVQRGTRTTYARRNFVATRIKSDRYFGTEVRKS
jgi:hypothetical protein